MLLYKFTYHYIPLHSQFCGRLVDATMCRGKAMIRVILHTARFREGEWKRSYSACFGICVEVSLVFVLYLNRKHSRFDVRVEEQQQLIAGDMD
jgi:hypothetical protein